MSDSFDALDKYCWSVQQDPGREAPDEAFDWIFMMKAEDWEALDRAWDECNSDRRGWWSGRMWCGAAEQGVSGLLSSRGGVHLNNDADRSAAWRDEYQCSPDTGTLTEGAEMLASVPYADLVGVQDPLSVLASTPDRLEALTQGWDSRRWSSTYAQGKWNAGQLVLHLAQDEIGWGNRARLGLTLESYVVQPYDGDSWVALESPTSAGTALSAFVGLRRLNVMLYERLSLDQRRRRFGHPVAGEISIEWIMHRAAGHDLHHLQHLQAIADL